MDSIAKRVFRCSWNASNHRFPSTRQAGKDLELVLRRDLKEVTVGGSRSGRLSQEVKMKPVNPW